MKPVIETNFKPFESVRFRQNAQLVSKDQLAAKRQQAISHYRVKARQAHHAGSYSPESLVCIQDIRQAFDLQNPVRADQSVNNTSDSQYSSYVPFADSSAQYTLQRGEFEFRVASGDLEYIPALEMTIITSYPEVEFIYTGTPNYVPPKKEPDVPALNLTI